MGEIIKMSQVRNRNKELQREYEKRHKENHPDSERIRKHKQRVAEGKFEDRVLINIMHLRRELMGIAHIPKRVDMFSDEFAEANRRFEAQLMEKVEVEECYV